LCFFNLDGARAMLLVKAYNSVLAVDKVMGKCSERKKVY
jgi:hypothetical protein